MLCSNCQICLNMSKENIHYPGHIIKYAMSPSRIETLGEGTVLMGNLKKIGWVVLKSEYNITPYCDLENELYHLNNESVKYKNKSFTIDGKQRRIFYKQSDNVHDSKSIDKDLSEIHELLQSDCNIINFHLEKVTSLIVTTSISIIIQIWLEITD